MGVEGLVMDGAFGLSKKFWSRVKKAPEGCWVWVGVRNASGYGQYQTSRKAGGNRRAHRVAFEAARGAIPPGLVCRHICDNPSCVNPWHVELGTQKDNMRDAQIRGRLCRSYPGIRGTKHYLSALTKKQVLEIRSSEKSGYQLAKEMGVSKSTIYNVRHGRTYRSEAA